MKNSASLLSMVAAFLLVFSSATVDVRAATQMPSFALENVRDGQIINSSAFKGKVLLLTFFATWCPPCRQEVPVLNELHTKLADAGFSVVGLAVDQNGPKGVAEFAESLQVGYPVLMAKEKTTRDFGGVYGIPVAFLVNRAGNVVKKYTGYVQHSVLENDIRGLID